MKQQMLLVLTTTSTGEVAESLGESIVENRLAACVQILPPMTSVYVWKGKIQKDREHLLLIKTLEEKFDDLEKFILENHSYDIPEIVALKAEEVSGGYLRWLTESL